MKKSVIGMADSDAEAQAVVGGLRNAGISENEISVLCPDRNSTQDFAYQHNTKAPEGAVAGASTGGVLGGTIGVLAGLGTIAIPGLGPFIAAGPVLAALSGAAAGAAVGGIAGALIGMGIPEIEVKRYEGALRDGNILIAVRVENSVDQARAKKVFELAGAHDVSSTSDSSLPSQPGLR